MKAQGFPVATRFSAMAAFTVILIVLAASSAAGSVSQITDNAVGSEIPPAALDQFGEFEVLDARSARFVGMTVDAETILSTARRESFGRAGAPQGSLLRVVSTELGLVPLDPGRLVWIFRWTALGEEYRKGFPNAEGQPMETVFVYNEYFLLADAETGNVIASVRH